MLVSAMHRERDPLPERLVRRDVVVERGIGGTSWARTAAGSSIASDTGVGTESAAVREGLEWAGSSPSHTSWRPVAIRAWAHLLRGNVYFIQFRGQVRRPACSQPILRFILHNPQSCVAAFPWSGDLCMRRLTTMDASVTVRAQTACDRARHARASRSAPPSMPSELAAS